MSPLKAPKDPHRHVESKGKWPSHFLKIPYLLHGVALTVDDGVALDVGVLVGVDDVEGHPEDVGLSYDHAFPGRHHVYRQGQVVLPDGRLQAAHLWNKGEKEIDKRNRKK